MAKPIDLTDILKLKKNLGSEGPELLIRLLLRTGMRTRELYNVSLKDLDGNNRTLLIHACKHSKNRFCPLGDLYHTMETALKGNAHISMLASPTGTELNVDSFTMSLRRAWAHIRFRVLGEHGKLYGLHSLRASAAQNLFAEGFDIITVQNFLGHKSMDSTYHYLQPLKSKGLEKKLL